MFENPSPKEPQYKELLDNNDREVIRRGLEVLREHFESAEVLPDIVIFQDVSARPLAHAVKPVLDSIYRKRNQPTPQYQFVGVSRKAPPGVADVSSIVTAHDEDEVTRLKRDALEDLQSILTRHANELTAIQNGEWKWPWVESGSNSAEERKQELIENIEADKVDIASLDRDFEAVELKQQKLVGKLKKMRKRFLDSHPERKNTPVSFLVVDDYMNQGTSYRIMREAILHGVDSSEEREPGDAKSKFSFFVFFENVQRVEQTTNSRGESTADVFKDLIVGMDSTDEGFEAYNGFRYRSMSGFDFAPGWLDRIKAGKADATGVARDATGDVQRADPFDHEKKRWLVGEMKKLGNEALVRPKVFHFTPPVPSA